jgi:hypothetical protein
MCVATLLTYFSLCAGALPPDAPKKDAPTAPGPAWSKPIDGVRARLVSAKDKYKVGEPIVLKLELENVSDRKRVITEPDLMPVISYPGSHPYEKHRFTWIITGEVPGRQVAILWATRETVHRTPSLRPLKPGEIHRLEITATAQVKERGPNRPKKAGDPQRVNVQFVGGNQPGIYLLRTGHRPQPMERPGADVWESAGIEVPMIQIEIVK